VGRRGHGYRDGFHPREKVIHLDKGCGAQLGGDLLRPSGVDVADTYQMDFVELCEVPGMVLAKGADSDDSNREP
jgi:hypothetical protein